MANPDIIIKDTHRGLWYEDGVLVHVLGAGRYELPGVPLFAFRRRPKVEVVLVDMRNRDLTIKGQEILTADKVAIRVSILVQYAVVDARSAIHVVASYEDRLYSDVQLAARRSLAAMTLEDILTNRHKLSEDILSDVKEAAAGYGVGAHEPGPAGGGPHQGRRAEDRVPGQGRGAEAASRSRDRDRPAQGPGRF